MTRRATVASPVTHLLADEPQRRDGLARVRECLDVHKEQPAPKGCHHQVPPSPAARHAIEEVRCTNVLYICIVCERLHAQGRLLPGG
jgi:hypothetical protein